MTVFNGLEYTPHSEFRMSAIAQNLCWSGDEVPLDRYDKVTRTVRVQINILVNYSSLER
jgi:hypothetical protein